MTGMIYDTSFAEQFCLPNIVGNMLILILTQKMSFDFHIARYLSQKMKECGGGGQSFVFVLKK
jgi:hypothetical protein